MGEKSFALIKSNVNTQNDIQIGRIAICPDTIIPIPFKEQDNALQMVFPKKFYPIENVFYPFSGRLSPYIGAL